MAKVKGQWRWNEVLSTSNNAIEEYVNYTSNNCQGELISIDQNGLDYLMANWDSIGVGGYAWHKDDGWEYGEEWRLIDFGTTEQEVSDEFYTYLTENAVAITWFETSKPGTTTLATAGKYCDRNIAVNVAIPTYAGEIVGALYIGSTGTVGGEIPQGLVTSTYYIIDDDGGEDDLADSHHSEDIFLEYGYAENNLGVTVPVLYKTNIDSYPDEIDYADKFFYEGTYEYDGVVYDKWRKMLTDSNESWDSEQKWWALTNRVVDRVVPYPVQPAPKPTPQ